MRARRSTMRSSPAGCARAVAARKPMLDAAHTGCRLVHAESDGLPGVIADRYGESWSCSCSSAGAEAWRDAIVAALVDATGCAPSTSAPTPKCARSKACRRAPASLPARCPRA